MDAYKSPATITTNITPEPQAWHLSPLKAIAVVLWGILAAPVIGVPTVAGGMCGMSLGVPPGNDGVWVIVVFPILCVIGLGWGMLSSCGLVFVRRRFGVKWSALAFIALAAGGGLFWLLFGYLYGSAAR